LAVTLSRDERNPLLNYLGEGRGFGLHIREITEADRRPVRPAPLKQSRRIGNCGPQTGIRLRLGAEMKDHLNPGLCPQVEGRECSVVAKLGAFHFTVSRTPDTVARMIRRTASISAAHGWSRDASSVSTSGFDLLAGPVTNCDVRGMESPEQVWRPRLDLAALRYHVVWGIRNYGRAGRYRVSRSRRDAAVRASDRR
jgi:hypothetical protein